MVELSIVLPCYNEAENIPLVLEGYRRLREEAEFELILVDNGSTDGTADLLERKLAVPDHSFARQVRVDVNRGYGAGIRAGLAECRGRLAAFSHADMQCSPGDLLKALALFKEGEGDGPLLVKGRRVNRRGLDAFVSAVYSRLGCLAVGLRRLDVNAQPKLFPGELISRLLSGPDEMTFDLFVLRQAARAGLRFVEFGVDFGARAHGESKWAADPFSKAMGIAGNLRRMILIRMGHYD